MNLFKLKKDGKCVGYLRIEEGRVLLNPIDRPGYWCIYDGLLCKYMFDEALPYVCTNKNGDKVFVNDKAIYMGHEVTIKENDGNFGYHLEFANLEPMEPVKTGKKLTNQLFRDMGEDIELLKEQPHD